MNLFERLSAIANDTISLDSYLKENINQIQDYYYKNFDYIIQSKDIIRDFVRSKRHILEDLDYEQNYNRAFMLVLFDILIRFNLRNPSERILSILNANNINMSSRLTAVSLYLNVSDNPSLINKFEPICKKLSESIENEEEDDEMSIIAAFLGFYAIVIRDTHPHKKYIEDLKQRTQDAIKKSTYSFLSHSAISSALMIETENADHAYDEIQLLIDKLLKKGTESYDGSDAPEEFLIEEETWYVEQIKSVGTSFEEIRSISVANSDGRLYTNRGVNILKTPEQLMAYMRRVGPMHTAKLETAFEALPDDLSDGVRLIDWGCGQGFASMWFIERYGSDQIKDILLIEPSRIALMRATLHIKKMAPDVTIRTICRKLDNIDQSTFSLEKDDTIIHFFSNILDIDDYSQKYLIELIEETHTGMNYFVCVSPYVDDNKTERLNSFKRHFENRYNTSFTCYSEIDFRKDINEPYWLCNNKKKYPHLKHGQDQYCRDYYTSTGGCTNKWTKVQRIFSVRWNTV